MNTALRDLRDELQALIIRVIEIEQYYDALKSGQTELDLKERYSRSHTGTWRGRQLQSIK